MELRLPLEMSPGREAGKVKTLRVIEVPISYPSGKMFEEDFQKINELGKPELVAK